MKIWKFYTLIALELFLIIVCVDSLFNENDTFDMVSYREAVGLGYFLLIPTLLLGIYLYRNYPRLNK